MSEKRPSQLANDGESYSFTADVEPLTARAFDMPADLSPELSKFIQWAINHPGKANQRELLEIRDQWEGGKKALSAKYFPMPKGSDPLLWEQNKKLLTHVNLVGTAIRTWVNAVYSEEAYRSVTGGYDELSTWIKSDEFAASMYAWAENKTAFGEAVAVPRWDDTLDELFTWLPDPCYTVIKYDPGNRRRVLGIAEITRTRIEFTSVWGDGYISDKGFEVVEYDKLDWLPAIVGGAGSLPKVRDALNATYAACAVMYNIRTLQKQQTKSLLVRKDDIEKLKALGVGGIKKGSDSSSVDVSPEGDAKFISPDPKIQLSIEVLRQQIIVLATASGIPADVLDPTLTESASSAEGSRIRAIPFIQNSKPLMRAWRADERGVVHAGEYILQMVKKKKPTYKDVRKAVTVDIGLHTAVIPMSANEETQDTIAKVSFGLMTPEDAVRKDNYTKSDTQVRAMADEIKRRMDEAGAQAHAQKSVGGGRPPEQSGAGGSVKDTAAT